VKAYILLLLYTILHVAEGRMNPAPFHHHISNPPKQGLKQVTNRSLIQD